MAVSKAQQKAVAKYTRENYDEIKVRISKGKKDLIKAAAVLAGESVNKYIENAVDARMSGAASAPGLSADIDAVTLSKAQTAADEAGETVKQFISRAVDETAKRDKITRLI